MLNNLNDKHLRAILQNEEFDFIYVLMTALEQTEKYTYLIEEVNLFSYTLRFTPYELLQERVQKFICKLVNKEIK